MRFTLLLVLQLSLLGSLQAQTQDLFNGKDLTGWTIYGTELWYVEDGLLVCESGPDKEYGYLGTNEEFKNFELTLEFKQGADGNSGVFIRSSIEGTKIAGWQAEVAPPGHSTGGIYESYGRGWLIKPDPEKDKFLKYEDWNTMKEINRLRDSEGASRAELGRTSEMHPSTIGQLESGRRRSDAPNAPDQRDLQVEERPIASIALRRGNPRTHSEKQIRQIAASIETFGFTNPLLHRRQWDRDRRPRTGTGCQAT